VTLRYGELFAGAGGLSLGLERAGFACAWHAELDENPRAVLRARWPDTPLYGDVTTLDGAALVRAHGPIDLLTGGSPCQDMSVAGKRAGLAGARSSLFHHQMRLWRETDADLCLWENVFGALSSNAGQDFAAVLGAFVGAAVPVPSDGWRSAGVVAGPAGVAAWRCLDCQWFGPPQRRLRVFVLGTRTGSVDPAAVLLEPEGVRGNPAPRREARESAPARARAGAARESGGLTPLAFSENQRAEVTLGDTFNQLSTGGGKPGQGYPAVLAGVPRRLTPRECERLMGWPDDWTLVMTTPSAKNGRRKAGGRPMSDAARYKMIGNGVASPVVQWIAGRLLNHITEGVA